MRAAWARAGLTFIGPTPEAIAAMGSKIEAKRRMQDSGVAVLASIAVTKQSAADLAHEAAALGPAILVKASAGGGGTRHAHRPQPGRVAGGRRSRAA